MLPVVAGRAATTRYIVIYSLLLGPISLLPWALGFAGTFYGVVAAIGGFVLVFLAVRLQWTDAADRRPAHRLFTFSIVHLFALFAALLVSCVGNRWPTAASAAVNAVGSFQIESAVLSAPKVGPISLNREV